MASKLRIIVTGLIAQHPDLGGVTWDYLQYVTGLGRLGHDVYYIEDSGEWPYSIGEDTPNNSYGCKRNVDHLSRVMKSFNLEDKWAYRYPVNNIWFGLDKNKVSDLIKTSDLLINISGTIESPEKYQNIPKRVYIDSDPVFTQIELANGNKEREKKIKSHNVHFSFGECLSNSIENSGITWAPTRQPIVLSDWHKRNDSYRDCITTVMNWSSYKSSIYNGELYGQKDIEMMKYITLPKMVKDTELEIALNVGKNYYIENKNYAALNNSVKNYLEKYKNVNPADLLRSSGWKVKEAMKLLSDYQSYRDYIYNSKAEWSISKNGYVKGNSGWFSCRSACYLAAGKPVIVQDTGFSKILPTGDGVLGKDIWRFN